MRLRFRCWAFCLVGAIRVCGLKGKNWSRFLIRPVDILWVLVRIGTSNDAGWSSPVAREAHNLEVVGSNPAPATQALRSHVASDRGVFSCAGRGSGRLIPLSANDLRDRPSPWASLFLPPPRHRCPLGLAISNSVFGQTLCSLSLAAPEVMRLLPADVSVWWFESGAVDRRDLGFLHRVHLMAPDLCRRHEALISGAERLRNCFFGESAQMA